MQVHAIFCVGGPIAIQMFFLKFQKFVKDFIYLWKVEEILVKT